MTAELRPGEEVRKYEPRTTDRNVPVPDPTRLTTQLVDRALAAFREVMEVKLSGLATAVELAADKTDAVPVEAAKQRQALYNEVERELAAIVGLTDEKIARLRDVTVEKFGGIDTRFYERDQRTEQAAQESRISLDAALAAAKEAVSEQNKANAQAIAKSEVATQKQIDANKTLMDTSIASLLTQIGDMKVTVSEMNARTIQIRETGTDHRASVGVVVAMISLAVVAGLGIVGFAVDLATR